MEELRSGAWLVRTLAHLPLTAPILNALLGDQRVFDDLPQAVAAAEPYSGGGHVSPEAGALQLWLSQSDLGGNVGNLFGL